MLSDYILKQIAAKKEEVEKIAEIHQVSENTAILLYVATTLGELDMKLFKIFNKEILAYNAEQKKKRAQP